MTGTDNAAGQRAPAAGTVRQLPSRGSDVSPKNVLITGGAGFIGRALVSRCLEEGQRVTVVDNLCVGRLENLGPFLDRIEFHAVNVLDAPGIARVMGLTPPDIVFHLAAHHFIPFCNEHPSETLRVNVEGTYNVLAEAARHGVSISLVASSGAIYPSHEGPLSEDCAVEPVDVYGLSKQMAEQVARFVSAKTGMRCLSARLFNTYGPYESTPHVIPEILRGLGAGPRIKLGNIHTKRDYVYVDDVALYLYRCARAFQDSYDVVNIGSGKEHSVEEIVRTIGTLLGREITIEVDPARVRTTDKLHQRADIRRLEEMAGALVQHDLAAGLRLVLEHEGLGCAAPGNGPDAAMRS